MRPTHRAVANTEPGAGGVRPALPGLILTGHVIYTAINALLFTNITWLMPLLVRLRFGAADPDWRDWQTTLITAAVPVFMMLSIFWNELLRRTTLRTYLLVFWLVAVLPLGCIALVDNYWQLLACHVVATMGLGGQTPLNGKLLKHFYGDAVRGRAYGIMNVVGLGGAIVGAYFLGAWIEAYPDAFRIYMPCVALLQLGGNALLLTLARRARTTDRPAVTGTWSLRDLAGPVLHMGATLRADRTFLRYERAFMTYGAAYMLCDALLPVLATAKLHMRYEEYAHAGQVIMRLATLCATLPMGWLIDRVGAVRTSGLAFALLAVYPLALMAATGPNGVAGASVAYGLALAGVQMGWMLGPVSLARTPDKVPHYAAIHATLVGIRGVVFQGLGMLLYKLTGSFAMPLVLATIAFVWAALQMRRLEPAFAARTLEPVEVGVAAGPNEVRPPEPLALATEPAE